jgi:hypothetical protein
VILFEFAGASLAQPDGVVQYSQDPSVAIPALAQAPERDAGHLSLISRSLRP